MHTLPAVIVAEHRQLAAACKPVAIATSITTVAADEPAALPTQRTLPIAIDKPAVVARDSQTGIERRRADLSWRDSEPN